MLQRNLKEFRLRRDSNPCLPDNSWTQLATELRNHTLAVRQTLEGFSLWISTLHFSKHRARKFGLVSCRRRIRPKKRYLIPKKYSPKTQNIDFSSVTFFFPLLADKLGVHVAKSLEHSPIQARALTFIVNNQAF